MCSFVGKTAADVMKHIEEHNKKGIETCLPCELCDYKAKTSQNFKEHIEKAHGVKINKNVRFEEVTNKDIKSKSGYCIYWNRGHCNFQDRKCRFIHQNIPACRYQERCSKPECKFFHDPSLGKFPFLGMRPRTENPPQVHPQRPHPQQQWQHAQQGPPHAPWYSQGRL